MPYHAVTGKVMVIFHPKEYALVFP